MENNWSNITNYIRSGYRSNAFAPFVWATGLVFMFIAAFYWGTSDTIIRYALIGLFVFLVISLVIIYFVLLIKDPRLLQSENYRLEDKKLDMITQKGSDFEIKPVELVTPNSTQIEERKNDE